MLQGLRPRLSPAMTVLAAIIVFLLLIDVAIATRIVATRGLSPGSSASQPQGATGHPCNHGDYGKCTAPLPAAGRGGSSGGSDDQSGSSGGSDD